MINTDSYQIPVPYSHNLELLFLLALPPMFFSFQHEFQEEIRSFPQGLFGNSSWAFETRLSRLSVATAHCLTDKVEVFCH